MINFSQENKIFNLRPVDSEKAKKEIAEMLVAGEEIVDVFATVRDQVIFTNKRIITVDVQGVGVKKDFVTIPYAKIQYFSVQTPGLVEIVHDNELQLFFSDGFVARFEFKGSYKIAKLAKVISEYALQ